MTRLAAQESKATPLGLLIDDLAIDETSREVIRTVHKSGTTTSDLLRSRTDMVAAPAGPAGANSVAVKPWSYVLGRLAGRKPAASLQAAADPRGLTTAQAASGTPVPPLLRPWSTTLKLLAGRPIEMDGMLQGGDDSNSAIPRRWRSVAQRSPTSTVSEFVEACHWE